MEKEETQETTQSEAPVEATLVKPDEQVPSLELAQRPAPASMGLPLPHEWQTIVHLATNLSRSNLVPVHLRNKPDDIIVIILVGRELSLPPMVALNNVNVIEGTPSLGAKLQMALVQRHGHEIWVETDPDGQSATAYGRRAGSDRVRQETFSLKDAQQAGLLSIDEEGNIKALSQQGKPMPWQQYPKHMLRARAVSALTSYEFADVMLGYTYTPEEAQEIAVARSTELEASEAARREREEEQREQVGQVGWDTAIANLPHGAIAPKLLTEDEKYDPLAVCPACKKAVVDFVGAKEAGSVKSEHPRWKCVNPECHGQKRKGRWYPWSSFHNDPWKSARGPGGSDTAEAAPEAAAEPAPEQQATEPPSAADPAPAAAEAPAATEPAPQAPDGPTGGISGPMAEIALLTGQLPYPNANTVLILARTVAQEMNAEPPRRTNDVAALPQPVLVAILDRMRAEIDWAGGDPQLDAYPPPDK